MYTTKLIAASCRMYLLCTHAQTHAHFYIKPVMLSISSAPEAHGTFHAKLQGKPKRVNTLARTHMHTYTHSILDKCMSVCVRVFACKYRRHYNCMPAACGSQPVSVSVSELTL